MWALVFILYFCNMFILSRSTIDINLSEYQYLADHLTKEECHQLVAALHFKAFDLPKELNTAERRLPKDVSCIDLLLHWNSTPKEGKGETHIELCHRLNQIGREDLAQWLSQTVFHEISEDLLMALLLSDEETATPNPQVNVTELYINEEIKEKKEWGEIDSVLLTLILAGLMTIIFGFLFWCCLCCRRRFRSSGPGYKELSTNEE